MGALWGSFVAYRSRWLAVLTATAWLGAAGASWAQAPASRQITELQAAQLLMDAGKLPEAKRVLLADVFEASDAAAARLSLADLSELLK